MKCRALRGSIWNNHDCPVTNWVLSHVKYAVSLIDRQVLIVERQHFQTLMISFSSLTLVEKMNIIVLIALKDYCMQLWGISSDPTARQPLWQIAAHSGKLGGKLVLMMSSILQLHTVQRHSVTRDSTHHPDIFTSPPGRVTTLCSSKGYSMGRLSFQNTEQWSTVCSTLHC